MPVPFCLMYRYQAYLFDIDSGKAELSSMTLDDSSLETEPKFEHGVDYSGIIQLNCEINYIAYDVRGSQCCPIARQSKCLDPVSNRGCLYFKLSDYCISYLQNDIS